MLSIINFEFELFQLSTIEMIILELHPLERCCLIDTHSKRILYLLLQCPAVFDGTLTPFRPSILFKLSFFYLKLSYISRFSPQTFRAFAHNSVFLPYPTAA